MSNLRQAAEQALEAWDDPLKDLRDLCVAMDAIHTALEQQAEPVAWMDREGDLYKMPEIPEWAPPHTMLYTDPPQRQWVGLTDEEIKATWSQLWCDINKIKFALDDRPQKETVGFIFAQAIEAKLKAKNDR